MKIPKRTDYAVENFDSLPSTNLYVKELYQEKKNRIVSARCQTAGRGTKGRSFSSNEGGIYISTLTFYTDFPAKKAFEIMQNCAVSVCKTLALYGVEACIKWPNDIHVNGKKICGILIENVFEKGNVASSLVGIGINVYNDLPEELSHIATTVSEVLSKQLDALDVEKMRETLLDVLFEEKPFLGEEYEKYLGYVGSDIFLLVGEERIPATLLSVTKEGGLVAKTERGEETFYSAEVSLRLKEEDL